MRRPVYTDSSASSAAGSDASERPEGGEGAAGDASSSSSGYIAASSLDRMFVSKVKEQTLETVSLLLRALQPDAVASGPDDELPVPEPPEALLALLESPAALEVLGRLIGLIRINSLSVQAASPPGEEAPTEPRGAGASAEGSSPRGEGPAPVVKGMATYAVASIMNYHPEPNCFVASDPQAPRRALVQVCRPVAVGDELCINYLAGAPFDAEERENILRFQYGIPVPVTT